MTLRKGDIVDLNIDTFAYGGRGIGRIDGLAVFVKGAIPGDKIAARVFKKKKAYAEAIMTELLQASPDRVPAPCPYFGFCGGCQWQNTQYQTQLNYKRGHINEAMGHIGGLDGIPIHDTIPSDKTYGYRNKMEFSFSDRRWLLPEEMDQPDADKGFALGLHVPGTFHKVIDVDACLLQGDRGNEILQEVKGFARDSDLPAYGLRSHQGFWRFLTLRRSAFFDQWMVNIVTSEEGRDVLTPLANRLIERFDNIRTIINSVNSRKASIAVGERELNLSGEGIIEDRIGPYTFQISANSFFQTNTRGAENIYNKVVEFAELQASDTVLDLYSGTGTIPIFLSPFANRVVGLEIVESAIRDAQRNCKSNGIEQCEFILGDLRETLGALKWKPDVLIIDPPRAGMHGDVLEKVMEMKTDRVVYVSCNPATLARDLGLMSREYEIVEIQPIDMFPHTYHVEAVTKLVRR